MSHADAATLITDRAAIEATFAADFESEAWAALLADHRALLSPSPDEGDEGSTPD